MGHEPLGTAQGIGDVAILDEGPVSYFLLAVSVMEGGVARADSPTIERAIRSLVRTYDRAGQGYPMYVPLIGSGRSRVGLSHEQSLRLILGVLLEETGLIQGRVVIMALPGVLDSIDLKEVRGLYGL